MPASLANERETPHRYLRQRRSLRRMVAAIEMYFDPIAERRLRILWTALEAANVSTLGNHAHGKHRPPHRSRSLTSSRPNLWPTRSGCCAAGSGELPVRRSVPRRRALARSGSDPALLALHAQALGRLDTADIRSGRCTGREPGFRIPRSR